MKTAFSITVLAVLLVAPGDCFAEWRLLHITKDRARELGMEVRSVDVGPPNRVRVELEFKVEGKLKEYDGRMKDHSRVELRISEGDNPLVIAPLREDRSNLRRVEGDNPLVIAPLREDRSKPGRVVVRFTADRTQLDKLNLWVMVQGTSGGDGYDLRVKDFVEREKGH